MAEIKKTFIAGKMNKDLDERLIPDGEYIDAVNVTIDTSGGSNIGSVSNSLGNTKKTDIALILSNMDVDVVNPKTIGSVVYEAGNLVYWFVCADNFDGVFEYSEITQETVMVIGSTTGQLNFNKNYIITGVDFIPANRGLGPYLYWTDGYNPPRRISISRAKQWGLDSYRLDIDIDVVLRPPLNAPAIKLYNDTAVTASNNLEQRFLTFSYRYKYKDNQYSAMSPFSSVAFSANSFSYDYLTGDNKGMQNLFNSAEVTIDSGNEFVDSIQLMFFDTYSINVYVVDTYIKSDMGWSDNQSYKINFSNNKVYSPIDSSQVTRLFDNVPLTARAQDVVGNRLIYGNYTQFRDIVNADNQKIVPHYTIDIESMAVSTDKPLKTFRSDRDYEIGILYTDEYGRMTTALTSENNTKYIPSNLSDKANSFKLTLDTEAPSWATNFRFAIKQAKGDYYNIFPYLFVIDGFYRYFLINPSDKDKIVVGEYIIFKTSNGNPTYSNKQFKVLELEQKSVGFVSGAPKGLYFKIKADASDIFLTETILTINKNSSGFGPKRGLSVDPAFITALQSPDPNKIYKSFYSRNGDYSLTEPSQNGSPNLDLIYNYSGNIFRDIRISVLMKSDDVLNPTIANKFSWTIEPDANSGYSSDIPISSIIDITPPGTPSNCFSIVFDVSKNYNTGDIYVFNFKSLISFTSSGFNRTVIDTVNGSGTSGLPNYEYLDDISPDDYGGHSILLCEQPIYPGATIEINILTDGTSDGDRAQSNSFTNGNDYYKNLEEWFWKSGAYKSFKYIDGGSSLVTSANNITFRRANSIFYSGSSNYINDSNSATPICMMIRGVGYPDSLSLDRSQIKTELKIEQTESIKLVAETVPKINDIDLFYELSHTYRIEDGNHKISWRYVDYTDNGGNTNLGPANPSAPTQSDVKHNFNVGEVIYVVSDNPSYGPASGIPYTIIDVPDAYSIVIDLPFPGSGPTTGGSVFYQDFEQDQDFESSTPLVVEINHVTSDNSDFNAFAFGNGIESNRINDNFLMPTMKYSPRATSVIENYQHEVKEASLTYSGIYRGDSSLNRLNEFNLSLANFKNLDKSFGPVRKLYARDTDLLVLHQDKVTSVLYGKNLLVDAVGGGSVASVPEVLGTQIAHPSEYGISNNPESFANFSDVLFWSDARRGAVVQMSGNQLDEISANGMKNYFRDIMRNNPNTQKLGSFDPYNNTYVISFNDTSVNPCYLDITPKTLILMPEFSGNTLMFDVDSNASWSITQETSPTWFMLNNNAGSGNGSVYATIGSPNESSEDRQLKLTIYYCGKSVDFKLIQKGTK